MLLSGDGATDCAEVVCLQLADDLPEVELEPVAVPRETLDRRPLPHPWDPETNAWYKRFGSADWVWTTRKFTPPRVRHREALIVRRYFALPPSALNAKMHVTACAVGGLRMYLDGEAVGQPKDGPEGADSFYAEFDRDHQIKGKKPQHVMEFCVKRTVQRPQAKGALPAGGLIYALELTWEEETKADVVKRLIEAWFGAVTSRFFRIFGLLGFVGFLAFALWPQVEATARGICGVVAAGFLGAWLSALIRIESERQRTKGKQG